VAIENDMTQPHILIAGIGNIFLGDDAFGSEVARRLLTRQLPAEVRVVDFGIRGLDLVYALLDGYELTIFVDATVRGGAVGTIYTIEPETGEFDNLNQNNTAVEPHGMNPMKVLAMVKAMGGEFKRILLVGCEPEPLGADEEKMGLSEPVALAVEEAANIIELLIEKNLGESRHSATK
jgi:hydrogenase maturation protease